MLTNRMDSDINRYRSRKLSDIWNWIMNEPYDYEERTDALERYGIDSQYLCCLNCVWFTDHCCEENPSEETCSLGKSLWGMSIWEE